MLKYLALILVVSGFAACSDRTLHSTVTAQNGHDGVNGHTIVSSYDTAAECECENASGVRVDFFVDTDDSLSATEGDTYLNSFVVCNGGHGVAGPVGPQGPAGSTGEPGSAGLDGSDASATIVAYSAEHCTSIAGTTTYVKKSGSNYRLYTTSTCSTSSVFATVSQGESYWASSNTLAVWYNTALRAITFN